MDRNHQVIQLSDVTVSINGLVVLDRISLEVARGEFAAVIGPNGAGKTTLLRVILGLIAPDSGTVRVFGAPVDGLGEMRARIGYVPQLLSVDLGFPVSVFELVLMGTYGRIGLARRPRRADRAATSAALEKVGIGDLADRPIARLSSGQRQRALIARALANSPELLLLDEPTTGVDVATTGGLYTLLGELKQDGVTVVMVSHDAGVVASYVDRVACLNRSLVSHGRPEDAACAEALREMYGCHAIYFHHGEAPHIVVEDH